VAVQRTPRPVQFATPSGNILCRVGDDALCTAFKHRWRAPSRPSDCDALAYGDTTVLRRSGSRSELLCQGDDTFFGDTPVLAYQHGWRYRNTQCVSRLDGVTCTNAATGHGFFISQDRYRLF
jgi:hypothetical protein